MKNKKICILTSVHPALDIRIFYKEAKTLVKAGYDVTLVAQHDKNETIDGIKIIALPKPKNRWERFFKLDRLTFKLASQQKAEIYHFHDPELIPWAVKLKKRTGAKIIYDVHENVPKQILDKEWIPKILRKIISTLFDFYEKRRAKNFDFIITVGEDMNERLKKVNSNVKTVKNFPDLEKFKNMERKTQEVNNNKVFNLIYIGGITKIRGITQLVRAMEYLPENVKLVLLGKFSPEGYKEEIRNLEGWSKVEFLGWIPFKDVADHLIKADIGLACLHPLKRYQVALPTKLFEYMAASLPVVASNFPLWREIIEGNGCGICVNPLEPKEIAKAVEYLIEHPKEAKEMGENGRRTVLEKYNWEAESKKLLNIYKEL